MYLFFAISLPFLYSCTICPEYVFLSFFKSLIILALFLIILPFVSLSASTCPRLQVYPRLYLILGHSGPHPCDITWHFFPFYPQRDASPSHVAPLCPGGSWPQLGGNFLGGHPHLHMVSNSNLWGEADASGNVYWLGFSFWLTCKFFRISVFVAVSPCLVCAWWPFIKHSLSCMSSLHRAAGATITLSCPGKMVQSIISHLMEYSM